jgi:hypothetical protein
MPGTPSERGCQMKNIAAGVLLLFFMPVALEAQLFTDPASNIGKKNLVVGAEYSSISSTYDLDTSDLPITSQRALLKVTAGLADWLDIYFKGGGVSLLLDYKEIDDNVVKNFNPNKMKPGFGAGTRIQLMNFVNSGTRVFFEGGGFFFNTDDDIESIYSDNTGKTVQKSISREMRWLDLYAGVGVSRRIDFIDLNFGIGLSEIKWWMKDDVGEKVGTVTSTVHSPWRDSFETGTPVLGFLGIDFVLPHEYRISAQAGIRNLDNAMVTISVSQGLEKD